MSDITPDEVNMRQVLAQVDRNIAEMGKRLAEQGKPRAEESKLRAEAAKLNRDRFLAPALALAATLGAIAAVAPSLLWIGGHG